MHKLLIIYLFTLSAVNAVEPYIAEYYQDKQAALSFGFDDGDTKWVADSLEVIDPLGIKGTFFIKAFKAEMGSKKHITWEQAKAMIANGHEMGTHLGGVKGKKKLQDVDEKLLDHLINGSHKIITTKTGVAPVSYAKPGGSQVTERVAKKILENHFFIREPEYLDKLHIIVYGTVKKKWDDEACRQVILKDIQAGKWISPLVHAIEDGYSAFSSKEEFKIHCQWLVKQKDLWIAPMGTVGRYVFERKNAALEITKKGKTHCTFNLSCSLENKQVFRHPLSVVIPTKAGRAKAVLVKTKVELPVIVADGKIVIDVVPNSGSVTVTW